MDRRRRGHRGWSCFLSGIGLIIVTPALALPPDLPVAFSDEMRLYLLMGSGVLLFVALVMRLMRKRDEVETVVIEVPRAYGMRFFPSDRPIALE